MRWAYLEYLWLAAAPVAVLLLFGYGAWRRRIVLNRAGDHALIQDLIQSLSPERRILKRFCFFFAVFLSRSISTREGQFRGERSDQATRDTLLVLSITWRSSLFGHWWLGERRRCLGLIIGNVLPNILGDCRMKGGKITKGA